MSLIAKLSQIRMHEPEAFAKALRQRPKADPAQIDGNLMIIACDHPARGALGPDGALAAEEPRRPPRPWGTGAGKGNLDEDLVAWGKALQAPNVRGLVIGRSLLFPADGDVATAVDKTVQLLK